MRHCRWFYPHSASCNRDLRLINDPILSAREKRLLRRLARGHSNHAIAHDIGGRDDQIGEQRKRLLQKLQVSSQSEIAEAASRWAFWPSYNLTTAADELAPRPKRRQDDSDKPPP
ncbi:MULTISPECIES: response regulator transcription factor [Nitrobacteraceae]|uniref:LuxR C-terminal-related transcriptional regulator n=1 Tax=Afipia birgiae TaxID=151414 RepID=UPI0009E74152